MNVIGIDYGKKKFGVAVANITSDRGILGVASPLEVIERLPGDDLLERLTILMHEWKAGGIVLGLPLEEDGSENQKSREIRNFGRDLIKHYKKKYSDDDEPNLWFQSELLSTRISNQGLSPSQKKKMGDAYAAADILTSYFSNT